MAMPDNPVKTTPNFGSDFYRAILDGIPSPVFVVEDDVCIVDFNSVAGKMLSTDRELVIRRRAGEVLHCVHSTDVPEGCGRGPVCSDCVVRNSVNKAREGGKVTRQMVKMEMVNEGKQTEALLLLSASPLVYNHQNMSMVVLEDISEVATLRGILPICSNCKQVRTDDEYWQSVEAYFETNLDIGFTHGMCPQCAKEFFPDYFEEDTQKP